MNILHVTSHLNVGGITTHVLSLSRALAERGHRVVIASGGGQMEDAARAAGLEHWPAPLHTSAEFSPQVFRARDELLPRARAAGVDVVHGHTRVGQVVADRLARRLSLGMVATWHGFFRPNLGRRLWPCTGDLTIAISEPVRQHLQLDFRVPEERIRLIPHGIDLRAFAAPVDALQQQRLREALRLPDGAPVIGTVARLVASKGVDQLIRSLPHIRQRVPSATLLIVGEGEERAPLERLARELQVAEAVRITGVMPETRTALSLMRPFVFLPARQEGFGLSLLEAMASAAPIVAVRRGGGASWLLDQTGAALLVPPEDPGALAEAVVRCLTDGDTASRSAAAARAVVLERFSLERMAEAVEAVYQELA